MHLVTASSHDVDGPDNITYSKQVSKNNDSWLWSTKTALLTMPKWTVNFNKRLSYRPQTSATLCISYAVLLLYK